MNTQHTPGPWLAASRASSVVGLPVVATPSGRSIASVTFFGLGKGFEHHEQESYANSRLIAAAPEMLAALWLAESAVQELCHDQHPDNQCWITLAEIRRALTKASA